MIDPLDEPRLKLDRAKEHLDALSQEISAFHASKPIVGTGVIDTDKGIHIIRVKLVKNPPLRMGIIAGDAVHNMRSGLDQLAWLLALLTTDSPYRRTEFPICARRTNETIKHFGMVTKDIPDTAKDIIESLQPYHKEDQFRDHPLWRLDHLWNIDKHRTIPVWGVQGSLGVPIIPGMQRRDFDDGTVEYIIPSKDETFRPRFRASVLFGGERDGNNVAIGLDHLFNAHDIITGDVIPRFAGFFT